MRCVWAQEKETEVLKSIRLAPCFSYSKKQCEAIYQKLACVIVPNTRYIWFTLRHRLALLLLLCISSFFSTMHACNIQYKITSSISIVFQVITTARCTAKAQAVAAATTAAPITEWPVLSFALQNRAYCCLLYTSKKTFKARYKIFIFIYKCRLALSIR